MKKTFLLLIALAFTAGMFGQTTIYNGENAGVGMWTDFLIEVAEVDNPSKDAVNSTDKCLRLSRGATSEAWSGTIARDLNFTDIKNYSKFTMMVKKEYAGPVQLEMQTEGEAEKIFLRADYNPATLNTWQKLDFYMPTANNHGQPITNDPITVILISIHRIGDTEFPDDDTYMYMDELVAFPRTTNANFNGETQGVDMWDSFLINAAVVDNPDKTGINATDKCLEINRVKDTDPWSGARAPGLQVSLADCDEITMMVKKEVAGPVKLELQTWNEGKKEVLEAAYTDAGAWEELTFTVPDNIFDGDLLGIILLQIHAVDTRDDDTYNSQLMYIDELNFGGSNVSVPEIAFDNEQIINTNVYSITGVQVAAFGIDAEIDLSSLAKGVYVIQQTDVNGNKNSFKVVVNDNKK